MLSRRVLAQLEEVLGLEAKEIGVAAKLDDVGQLMYEGKVHPFGEFTLGDVEQLINISALPGP